MATDWPTCWKISTRRRRRRRRKQSQRQIIQHLPPGGWCETIVAGRWNRSLPSPFALGCSSQQPKRGWRKLQNPAAARGHCLAAIANLLYWFIAQPATFLDVEETCQSVCVSVCQWCQCVTGRLHPHTLRWQAHSASRTFLLLTAVPQFFLFAKKKKIQTFCPWIFLVEHFNAAANFLAKNSANLFVLFASVRHPSIPPTADASHHSGEFSSPFSHSADNDWNQFNSLINPLAIWICKWVH